ncbi:MAG: hypothetical protein WBW94_04520 [Anaerolineales bacterium]
MRGFFESLIVFWKPDVEFISSLSINTCQNRLEDLGAKTSAGGWPWTPIDKIPIHFFLKGRDYSFWKQGPAISGTLKEIKEGTKVTGYFGPPKRYSSVYSFFFFLLFFLFYEKDFVSAFFLLLALFLLIGFIYSDWSSWESLESKLIQNLKSWKRDF